jgi:hypothetical protein
MLLAFGAANVEAIKRMEGVIFTPNAQHQPWEPAAIDAGLQTDLNGWLPSAACCCWASWPRRGLVRGYRRSVGTRLPHSLVNLFDVMNGRLFGRHRVGSVEPCQPKSSKSASHHAHSEYLSFSRHRLRPTKSSPKVAEGGAQLATASAKPPTRRPATEQRLEVQRLVLLRLHAVV